VRTNINFIIGCVSFGLAAAVALGNLHASALSTGEDSASVEVPTEDHTTVTGQKPSFSLFSRFPVVLTLSVNGGYDSNVNTSGRSSQGSVFDETLATVSYDAGTERSHLTITAATSLTYYFDHASSPNPEVAPVFSLSGRHNFSERLDLSMNVDVAYQAEPDFSADIGPDRRVGYFLQTTDTLAASYRWTSLISSVSTETFRLVHYDDATTGAFQDRIENTLGQQVLFHITLRSALVAEYRFQLIDYDSFPNDSDSHYILGGIDHSFNSRVNVTLRGGVTFRSYSDNNQSTKAEPQFDGALNYSIGPHSSLTWRTSYGLEAPDSPTVGTTTAFRTGVELRYGLTPRISSNLAAYYVHDDNQSFNFPGTGSFDSTTDSYDISINLQYAVVRHWSVQVGFETSGASSNAPGSDYTRQRYSAGVNFTF
jgi:hypothetical protein